MTEHKRTVQVQLHRPLDSPSCKWTEPSGLLILLDQFDVDDDGNIVADHDAAIVQSSVPLHAKVLAVDLGGRVGGSTGIAPGVLHRSRRTLNVEHNFLGRAADGEVAGDLKLPGSELLDFSGLESNRRVVGDIEEFFTAQVVIAVEIGRAHL